jgi:hypothetical protein
VSGVSGPAQSPWPMFRKNAWHSGYDWSRVGSGVEPGEAVLTFALGSGNVLYAGGSFATAGGVTVNGVASWNGSSWAVAPMTRCTQSG